jgi:hypothetical protein
LDYARFIESAWLLGPRAFTYGKIGPRYNLILMCSRGRPPTQKRLKFCAIGLKGNWPGL